MITPKSLFTIEGRIGRQDYLIVQIGLFFSQFVLMTFYSIIIQSSASLQGLLSLTAIPLILGLIWISLAAQIKRWHDVDKSGFWCFIVLVPILGALYAIYKNFFVKGTTGPNRFGSDPLGEIEATRPQPLPPL